MAQDMGVNRVFCYFFMALHQWSFPVWSRAQMPWPHLGPCRDYAFLGLSPDMLPLELWGEAFTCVLRSPPDEAACHTLEFEDPPGPRIRTTVACRDLPGLSQRIHLGAMAFGLGFAVNRCKI